MQRPIIVIALFIALLASSATAEDALDAAGVYRAAAPSVVVVEGMTGTGGSQGSGVVVADRQVVTNFHVVRDTVGFLLVRQGERTWRAEVEAVDEERDLATLSVVLRRSETFDLPVARKRASWTLEIGERVYAIGSPRGLERTLSDGLISGLPALEGTKLVQTTAAISPGSSGGGLFDQRGALVGITTAYLKDSQSLNFAVSSDDVLRLQRAPPRWEGKPYVLEPPTAAPRSLASTSTKQSGVGGAPVPDPALPLPLSAVTAVFLVTASTGPVATAGGMTEEWMRARIGRRLRNKGIWVFESREEAIRAKKYAVPLMVGIDSMNIEDTVFYPWRITLYIFENATYADGELRPVVLWSDGTFGFGGSSVVTEQVAGALDERIDELATKLGRDGRR